MTRLSITSPNGANTKKGAGEGKPSPIFRNMNNLFNTMNNLISNQNDGTFTNIENPITSFASYGQQMIDQAKNEVKEGFTSKDLQNAVASGVGNTEVGNELKLQMDHEKETAIENEKAINDAMNFAKEEQLREWQREDEIRKEVQQREDTALQRWVEDARKAGINPNIFSGQGAASGGGITSATGLNMTQYETVANRLLTEWEKMVDQEFEKNENKKDRFNNIMRGLINLAGIGIFAGKRK